MMQGQMNVMRREAERANSGTARTRIGTVTAYDPTQYAAKAIIEPDGYETGWLPVATPWSGNGWGMFCPPTPGDTVEVHFQEGGKEAGIACLRFYGNKDRPLPVPSGEFWLVHNSGAFFKLTNDGKVTLNSTVEIDATAPVASIKATTSVSVTAPQIHLGGEGDTLHKLVTDAMVALFNTHVHSGVQPGGGNTGVPNVPMTALQLTSVVSAD